ncbi:MAG: restriction endonuclease [Gammaproteobacteria bacterium]|nr:MAG: restriction endonuclease [Gammaproteobacteria bacterium]
MPSRTLRDLFEGAAAKYLSAVDAEKHRSNQHEIGGLVRAGFREYLGSLAKGERRIFPATMAYLPDDDQEPEIVEGKVTWYDARAENPVRGPEYRLYYPDNPVTERIEAGDFLLIAKNRDGRVLMVFAPHGSEAELQIRSLFGVEPSGNQFETANIGEEPLVYPVRLLLEDLGITAAAPDGDDDDRLLALLTARFSTQFPRTEIFSQFARDQVEVDALADPDAALLQWMETEERMFRIFEKHIVANRLQDGFGRDGVDEFISFSLSVQNRRKSRAGRALENHLAYLFSVHQLEFQRGGHGRVTENNAKPDFLFPSFAAYHDQRFPSGRLRLLGAKTSCKDRWRQVLSEGERIQEKHLLTLEPGISDAQTGEMKANRLRLVVPEPLQKTYPLAQRQWLMTLKEFIDEVRGLQGGAQTVQQPELL